jgi:hypothetical protein
MKPVSMSVHSKRELSGQEQSQLWKENRKLLLILKLENEQLSETWKLIFTVARKPSLK